MKLIPLAIAVSTLTLLSQCKPAGKDQPKYSHSEAPSTIPQGMVWIPGGQALMGSNFAPNESPVHEIAVDGFYMDETEVSNAQFEAFVKATNYVTFAERQPKLEDFPESVRANIQIDQLKPGAILFSPPPASEGKVSLSNHLAWWKYVDGANWRQPHGPGSSIEDKMDHPVVCLTWEDAQAYAKWAGKRLPTEAEWEYAAQGGVGPKKKSTFSWGEEDTKRVTLANTWNGDFPLQNDKQDGFQGTSPVKTYPPNAFGLYDMAGNVWEFVSDWYQPNYFAVSPKLNPKGPLQGYDPNEPGIPKKVIKGGSYLCNPSYCTGYRPSSRMFNSLDSATNHTGFRCVKDVAPSA